MLTQLMGYAQGSPLLLAGLVVAGALLAVIERVFALSGPITKLVRWWQGRELNRLRREALLRAERRRIAAEEEAGRVADLSAQLAELRAEVAWMRAERERHRQAEASERHRRERYDRVLTEYVWALLSAARSAGVTFAAPPVAPSMAGPATDPGRNPALAVPSPR